MESDSSLEDFQIKSNSIIFDIKENEIKNYDEIKDKTSFIKRSTVTDVKVNKLFSEKKINIHDFKRKILKHNTEVKIDLDVKEKNNFKYKNKEKINEIKRISKKINNLIYSKINVLDFNNFNNRYYSSNVFNLLSYKKLRKFKNLNSNQILKNIYYEYNKKENDIKFSSNFELGNLNLVYNNADVNNSFDLIISSDKNIELSTGWFYFKMIGASRGQKINLNIVNLVRSKSLYNKKRIAIKSVILNNNKESIVSNWKYLGENIKFSKSNNTNFYILSFEYTFRYDKEIVYFAENIPYDLNKNEIFLNKVLMSKNDLLNIKINTFYLTNINYKNYYISLTSNNNKQNKPVIVILSRIQPSHNCSSYVLEGMVKYLTRNFNDSNEFLLNNYEWIIIPFLSFEMVMFGNTRHTIAGINLSNFQNKDMYRSNELNSLKNLLTSIKKNKEIDMIFEIHDNPFKNDYYFHIFSFNEDKVELKEYNNFLNIMNYNMNFFKKEETVMVKDNNKFLYYRKNFNIKFLFNFYVSTFGSENNDFEFMPSDYRVLGKNIAYSLSIFYAKINKKAQGKENLRDLIFEIDDYFQNIDTKENDLIFKRKDSFGSNNNFFLEDRDEMHVNKLINKVNQNELIDEDLKLENKYQKKLISKYVIQHKRDFRTKRYDYVIKRSNKKFQIKTIKNVYNSNNKNNNNKNNKNTKEIIENKFKTKENIYNFNFTISNNYNYSDNKILNNNLFDKKFQTKYNISSNKINNINRIKTNIPKLKTNLNLDLVKKMTLKKTKDSTKKFVKINKNKKIIENKLKQINNNRSLKLMFINKKKINIKK